MSEVVNSQPKETTVADVNAENDSSVPKAASIEINADPRSSVPVVVFRSYERGLVNGVLNLDKEPFKSFTVDYFKQAENELAQSNVHEKICELKSSIETGRAELEKAVQGKFDAEKNIEQHLKKRTFIERIIGELEKRLQYAKEHLIEIKEKYTSDYTLLPAIFFFVAGILFIAADYGLALTIIGDALQIGLKRVEVGDKVSFEPGPITYLFASGLAAISFALKPAYDRIIEKKYPEGKTKEYFNWTILIVSFLVLGMLFTMGVFREKVIEANLQIAQVGSNASSINIGDPLASGFSPVPPNPSGGSVSGSSDDGGGLVSNIWALFSIVLSTCLFAITGAICMGIATPVLHKNGRVLYNYWMQSLFRQRLNYWRRKLLPVETRCGEYEVEIKQWDSKKDMALARLELAKELIEREKEHNSLISDYFRIRADKANALYEDGYNRGQMLGDVLPQDWAKEQIFNGSDLEEDHIVYNQSKGQKEEDSSLNGYLSRSRPFLAVRKMITGRFRRKYFDTSEPEFDVNQNS